MAIGVHIAHRSGTSTARVRSWRYWTPSATLRVGLVPLDDTDPMHGLLRPSISRGGGRGADRRPGAADAIQDAERGMGLRRAEPADPQERVFGGQVLAQCDRPPDALSPTSRPPAESTASTAISSARVTTSIPSGSPWKASRDGNSFSTRRSRPSTWARDSLDDHLVPGAGGRTRPPGPDARCRATGGGGAVPGRGRGVCRMAASPSRRASARRGAPVPGRHRTRQCQPARG